MTEAGCNVGAWQVVETLVGEMAWPSVVAGLAIGFRKPIRALAPRIKTLRVGNFEVTLREVEGLALRAGPPPIADLSDPIYHVLATLDELADISPAPATIAAHDVLATELQNLVLERQGWRPKLWSPSAMATALTVAGVMGEPPGQEPKSLHDVLGEATAVARKVQDGADIGTSEAKIYVATVGVLIGRVRSSIRQTPAPGA
jgi:hypothetical protein